MNSNKTTILGTLVAVLSCAFLAVSAFAVYLIYNAPLAEPMTIVQEATAVPAVVAGSQTQQEEPAAEKPAETCGNTGSMVVLFTGADFSIGVPPLGADAVRVAKVDFDNKKITVVAFPRDLWVKTPELVELNYPESRLGLAYHYKKESIEGSDKHKITAATEMIGQVLYDNFGVAPQHYLTLQLDNTAAMIDTIGGVEINVPETFTTERDVVIPAGTQTMDGKLVTEYVRSYVQGEKARLQHQNLFVKALQTKVLRADILPKVPDLYKQFDKAIVTDLSARQLNELACMSKEVPQNDITFYEIDSDLVTAQADGTLNPDIEKISIKLKEWLGQ